MNIGSTEGALTKLSGKSTSHYMIKSYFNLPKYFKLYDIKHKDLQGTHYVIRFLKIPSPEMLKADLKAIIKPDMSTLKLYFLKSSLSVPHTDGHPIQD